MAPTWAHGPVMNVEMWGEVYYVYNVSKIHSGVAAGSIAESISLPD